MMKMISKKHTSKFVAGFLQGLGLVACVSFTSCGDKDSADKQKRESLRNSLKDLSLDDEKKEKIVNYCIENKAEIKDLTGEILGNLGLEQNEISGFLTKYGSTSPKSDEITGSINNGVVTVESENFDFRTLKGLNEFSGKFNGKKVKIGGFFDFELENDNIKVCGGSGIEFNEVLVKAFKSLMFCGDFFEGFNLNINSSEEVCFGGKKVPDALLKKGGFWDLVKGYPAVFGFSDKKSKLGIEENGNNGDKVKIGNFVSDLKYSEVVKDGKVDGDWNKIFELKTKN